MEVYVIILVCYLISAVSAYFTIKKDYKNLRLELGNELFVFVLIPFFNIGATYAAIRSINKFNKNV